MKEPQLEATEELRVHLVESDEVRRILVTGGIMQALHAAPLWQFLLSQRG